MQSFEQLEIGEPIEHVRLEGNFQVAHKNPTVLMRTKKLTSLDGWYAQGPRGVLLSLSFGDVRRGDILRSSRHQGEFVVSLVTEEFIFVVEMRLIVDPRGWWVTSPTKG